MRQYLLITVVLVGAGCHGLGDCRRGGRDCHEPCKTAEKKPCAPPARSQAAPPEQVDQVRAALAQEVLLVPRTVYMPFVAQTPTAPVRLTSHMQVVQPPPERSVALPPAQQVTAPPKEECAQQEMLDLCKKLNQRLDHMERCLHDRKLTPRQACPEPCCPPSQPMFPQLFRRPLFNRGEPAHCEPANCVQCEQVIHHGQPVQSSEPLAAPRVTTSNANDLAPIPQPAQPIEPLESPRILNTNPESNVNPNAPLSLPQTLPLEPMAPMPNE